MPFVSKIDLFQLVSVDRKLEDVRKEAGETKEQVKDLKQDMNFSRSLLAAPAKSWPLWQLPLPQRPIQEKS
jgi:hypothetical protein